MPLRSLHPWTRFAAAVLGAATALLFVQANAGADARVASADSTQAEWTQKQVHFVFQGFTTHYSCQGLEDKVRKALLKLGARKDLKVDEGACWRPAGGPEPFPGVDVRMNVLEPLRADTRGRQSNAVAAHWMPLDLKLDQDPLGQAGDCELLEQIKNTFLPLFATRNVDYKSSCAAHQVFPAGSWLRGDVLVTDQDDR